MKHLLSTALIAVCLSVGITTASAQTAPVTNTPTTDTPAAAVTDKQKATLEKHLKPILTALALGDAAKEATVSNAFATFSTGQSAWHQANDAKLKTLWNQFNKARSKQNNQAADQALADIDAIYATCQPQHQQFLADLGTVLTPAQVETVEDVLTVNKVKVTYNVYLQIFPSLTEAQKAVVLKDLKAAREQAIDAGSMAEKSAFFKKYKIQIEDDYLTAQGYNPKQARKDFANKAKTDAPKKADDAN